MSFDSPTLFSNFLIYGCAHNLFKNSFLLVALNDNSRSQKYVTPFFYQLIFPIDFTLLFWFHQHRHLGQLFYVFLDKVDCFSNNSRHLINFISRKLKQLSVVTII